MSLNRWSRDRFVRKMSKICQKIYLYLCLEHSFLIVKYTYRKGLFFDTVGLTCFTISLFSDNAATVELLFVALFCSLSRLVFIDFFSLGLYTNWSDNYTVLTIDLPETYHVITI